ncbi:MAG: hypothetical protein K2K36_04155, partial [Muribaculaceae bacterium]|nr:hypothetical protein [Muribaculaceae bacterium]
MKKTNVRRLAVAVIAIIAIVMGISGMKGQQSAMPRTELKKVEARLQEAVDNGRGEECVGLLKQMWELEGALDAGNCPKVIERIAQVRATMTDPVSRSLLSTLEFAALGQYYSNDGWRIDQREDVGGMTGSDITLWSRRQFRLRIEELVDSALSARPELLLRRSSEFDSILQSNSLSELYYPTLYDAVASQAVATLGLFVEGGGVLNARLTREPMDSALYPDPARSVYGRILSVYRSMAEGRNPGSAPAVAATASMLGFISDNMFDDDDIDRFDIYAGAYRRVADSEYAPLYLTRIETGALGQDQRQELYGMLAAALKAHPGMPEAAGVKNMMARLAAKAVDYVAPRQVFKGEEFTVNVKMRNCTSALLSLVDVSGVKGLRPDDDYYNRRRMGAGVTVDTARVACGGEIPFTATVPVKFKAPAYGVYVIVPGGVEGLAEDTSLPVIRCSDLSGGAYGEGKSQSVVAVDAMTGAPVKDVAVMYTPWRNNAAPSQNGALTSADGFTRVRADDSGSMTLRKGKDRYGSSFQYFGGERRQVRAETRGEVYTALALYRPGDEVRFSFVAFTGKNGDFRPASGREFTLQLMRNYSEKKGSQTITSDEWGRGEGLFTLPVGEPGDYAVSLRDGDRQIGICRFTVSDYRLPTFEVKVDEVVRPARAGANAGRRGRASTFAGFPVDGAPVR